MFNYLKQDKSLVFFTILFSLITSFANVFIAVLLQQILDAATNKDMQSFIQILLFSLGYFVLLTLFMYLYSRFSKKLICKVVYTIRSKTFRGTINHNVEDFNKINTADYLSAITNDVKMLEENYLSPLLDIFQNITIFVTALAVMFYFDVIITVVVIVAMLVMLILPGLFGGAMQKCQNDYSGKLSAFTNHIKDLLSGFEVIKSYYIKQYAISKFEKSNQSTTDAKFSVDKLMAANEAVSMMLSILIQVTVIFLSAYFIIIGRITAGALLGMVQSSGCLVNPLLMIFNSLPKLQSVKPIIERVNKISEYKNTKFSGTHSPSFESELFTKNLSFSYDGENHVLRSITLHIKKGKKYALAGKSGCGKTTLIKLLTGYYSTYQGDILYDDIGISELDYDKFTKLSTTIHQDVYMFNESIYDNVCLHYDYTNDELQKALDISGVSRFIAQTHDGLNTIVDENGANLSGGQKQRIAVARAIIQSKPILILDEGTSAIDMQTAYDIESRLLNMDGLTLITITHNMKKDILEQYDQIVFMKNGAIDEIGTYEELINKRGGFFDFSQLKTSNAEGVIC